MLVKVKYQIAEHKFIYVEIEDNQVDFVKTLNRDFEREKKRDEKNRRMCISIDSYFDNFKYEYADLEESISDKIILKESEEIIWRAIQELSDEQRYIIIEHFWNDKSLRKIALEKCVNHNTINKSYKLAMAILKEKLRNF